MKSKIYLHWFPSRLRWKDFNVTWEWRDTFFHPGIGYIRWRYPSSLVLASREPSPREEHIKIIEETYRAKYSHSYLQSA